MLFRSLKLHTSVRDAVVVGVPDDRFGEAVTAVLELKDHSVVVGEAFDHDVVNHVKGRLASYKAPRHVVIVETIGRSANGKVDYQRLRQLAADRLAERVAPAP